MAADRERGPSPSEKEEKGRGLTQQPEFRLGIKKKFLTSGGSSQKGLGNVSIWKKGFLSFLSSVAVGGPCLSLSLLFTQTLYMHLLCARCVAEPRSHDPWRPHFGTEVYLACREG